MSFICQLEKKYINWVNQNIIIIIIINNNIILNERNCSSIALVGLVQGSCTERVRHIPYYIPEYGIEGWKWSETEVFYLYIYIYNIRGV